MKNRKRKASVRFFGKINNTCCNIFWPEQLHLVLPAKQKLDIFL